MDIERLKEHDLYVLRGIVSGLEEEQSIDPVIARQFEKVIDEAIARQSVIDEDVIEAIEYLQPLTEHPIMSGNFAKHIKTAITALKEYQPWIPVSESLPDGDVASVLIYTKEGGVAEGQYYQSISAWKQFRWSVEDSKVTHWKPLPELPKGETE